MMKALLLFAIIALVAGCKTPLDVVNIRQGVLITDQRRDYFLQEWGPPTRTYSEYVTTAWNALEVVWNRGSKENATASVQGNPITSEVKTGSGDGGFAIKRQGGRVFNIWVYEKRGVTLVFDRESLAAWRWHDGATPR